MKKNSILWILLTALIWSGSISCGDDNDDCVRVLGPVRTETRTLPDFHNISLSGVGTVYLTQGPREDVTIETHNSIMEEIMTMVENNTLYIASDHCLRGAIEALNIYITIPEIRRLDIHGVGDVIGQNDFNLEKLTIDISGVGNLELSGSAEELVIMSSGVGNIHAFDLETKFSSVLISGTGNVEIHVTSSLAIIISGSGSVYYKGNPAVDTDISGTGNVISVD